MSKLRGRLIKKSSFWNLSRSQQTEELGLFIAKDSRARNMYESVKARVDNPEYTDINPSNWFIYESKSGKKRLVYKHSRFFEYQVGSDSYRDRVEFLPDKQKINEMQKKEIRDLKKNLTNKLKNLTPQEFKHVFNDMVKKDSTLKKLGKTQEQVLNNIKKLKLKDFTIRPSDFLSPPKIIRKIINGSKTKLVFDHKNKYVKMYMNGGKSLYEKMKGMKFFSAQQTAAEWITNINPAQKLVNKVTGKVIGKVVGKLVERQATKLIATGAVSELLDILRFIVMFLL